MFCPDCGTWNRSLAASCSRCHAGLPELAEGVSEKGYRVNSSLDHDRRSQILALTTGSPDADLRAHVALSEVGVVTAMRSRGIRVAPSFYNDVSDIERLIEALPEYPVSHPG